MRREFCDRCGVEGGNKTERALRNVPKVVRVTWVPLARVMDLCGPCRKDLDLALDDYLAALHSKSDVEVAPGVYGTPPDEAYLRSWPDGEEE